MEALKQAPGNSLPHRGRAARLREASLHRGYSWPAPRHYDPPGPALEREAEREEEKQEERQEEREEERQEEREEERQEERQRR